METTGRHSREVLITYSGEVGQGQGKAVSSVTTSGATTPQLGDAFVDRLLEVSRQGDNLAYRQELNKLILSYENSALDVDNEVAEIQLTLDSLSRAEQGSSDTVGAYVLQVQKRLPQILSTLREHTQAVKRIHTSLGLQAVGTVSRLIQTQGGSFRQVTDKPVTNTDIKTLVALLVLTLFGTLFISLVMDIYRDRKKSEFNS